MQMSAKTQSIVLAFAPGVVSSLFFFCIVYLGIRLRPGPRSYAPLPSIVADVCVISLCCPTIDWFVTRPVRSRAPTVWIVYSKPTMIIVTNIYLPAHPPVCLGSRHDIPRPTPSLHPQAISTLPCLCTRTHARSIYKFFTHHSHEHNDTH